MAESQTLHLPELSAIAPGTEFQIPFRVVGSAVGFYPVEVADPSTALLQVGKTDGEVTIARADQALLQIVHADTSDGYAAILAEPVDELVLVESADVAWQWVSQVEIARGQNHALYHYLLNVARFGMRPHDRTTS